MKKRILWITLLIIILGIVILRSCQREKPMFSGERLNTGKAISPNPYHFIDSNEANSFVKEYKNAPLEIYSEEKIPNSYPIKYKKEKGFFLDSYIIDSIIDYKNKHNINGLYLYLAKKTGQYGGKYTLIAIPSILEGDSNRLLLSKCLEWHDPISICNTKNETSIGY